MVILTIIAVFIPINVAFSIDTSANPRFQVQTCWLYGLVKWKLGSPHHTVVKEDKKKRLGLSRRTLLKMVTTSGLMNNTFMLVWSVFRRIRLKELKIDLKVGLDDPAETGMLFALVGPVLPLVNLPRQCYVNVEPSFREATLDGQALVSLSILPISLAVPVMKFVFSKPFIKIGSTMLISRQGNN
jgi:hypothetical protein